MDISLRQVSIHGREIAYRMEGSGPALLLLHGIAGSSQAWREVMPGLAEHYCVIAPDMLGHGESAKPIGDYSLGAYASGMRDLLHILDIEAATIIGQSFGGGVALQMAYQHPECCERLVLVDSGGLGREVNWVLRLATLPGSEYAMPLLFPSVVRNVGDRVGRFFHDHGIRVRHVAEAWSAYSSLTEGENRQAFVRTVRAVIDPGGQTVNAMDKLYLASRLPTLIIWGERDAIIPISHAHDAHEAIPGSRLEIIAGAGHSPQVDAPEEFLAVLIDFIKTTQPAHFSAAEFQQLLKNRTLG
jgi:pimeloyl-ACP methyl ester carboxylesterase